MTFSQFSEKFLVPLIVVILGGLVVAVILPRIVRNMTAQPAIQTILKSVVDNNTYEIPNFFNVMNASIPVSIDVRVPGQDNVDNIPRTPPIR